MINVLEESWSALIWVAQNNRNLLPHNSGDDVQTPGVVRLVLSEVLRENLLLFSHLLELSWQSPVLLGS